MTAYNALVIIRSYTLHKMRFIQNSFIHNGCNKVRHTYIGNCKKPLADGKVQCITIKPWLTKGLQFPLFRRDKTIDFSWNINSRFIIKSEIIRVFQYNGWSDAIPKLVKIYTA